MIIQAIISGYITGYRNKESKGNKFGILDVLQFGDASRESSIIPIYVFDVDLIGTLTEIAYNNMKPISCIVSIKEDKTLLIALEEIIKLEGFT